MLLSFILQNKPHCNYSISWFLFLSFILHIVSHCASHTASPSLILQIMYHNVFQYTSYTTSSSSIFHTRQRPSLHWLYRKPLLLSFIVANLPQCTSYTVSPSFCHSYCRSIAVSAFYERFKCTQAGKLLAELTRGRAKLAIFEIEAAGHKPPLISPGHPSCLMPCKFGEVCDWYGGAW